MAWDSYGDYTVDITEQVPLCQFLESFGIRASLSTVQLLFATYLGTIPIPYHCNIDVFLATGTFGLNEDAVES